MVSRTCAWVFLALVLGLALGLPKSHPQSRHAKHPAKAHHKRLVHDLEKDTPPEQEDEDPEQSFVREYSVSFSDPVALPDDEQEARQYLGLDSFAVNTRHDAFICNPENTVDMTSVNLYQGGPSEFKAETYNVRSVLEAWGPIDDKWASQPGVEWKAIFKPNEPAYTDVRQGNVGDCYLLASLKAILTKPWGPRYLTQVLTFHHRRVYVPVYERPADDADAEPTKTWESIEPEELPEHQYLGRLRLYQERRCIIFPLQVVTSKCGTERCMVGANRNSDEGANWVNVFETAFTYYKWYKRNFKDIERKFNTWKDIAPDMQKPRIARPQLNIAGVGMLSPEFTLDENLFVDPAISPDVKRARDNLFSWYNPTVSPATLAPEALKAAITKIRSSVTEEAAVLSLGMISGGHASDVDPLFFTKAGWNTYAVSSNADRLEKIRTLSLNVLESDYFTKTKVMGNKVIELRLSLYVDHTSDEPDDWIEIEVDGELASTVFATKAQLTAFEVLGNIPITVVDASDEALLGDDDVGTPIFCKSSIIESPVAWSVTPEQPALNCGGRESNPNGVYIANPVDPATAALETLTAPDAQHAAQSLVVESEQSVQAFKVARQADGSYLRTNYKFMMLEYKLGVDPAGGARFYVPGLKMEGKDMRGVNLVESKSCPYIVESREAMAAVSRWWSCSTYAPIAMSDESPPHCVQDAFQVIKGALSVSGHVAVYASTRPNTELPACCHPLLSVLMGRNGEAMCHGIAYGHAYAVIGAKTQEVGGRKLMFVLLSNPWGAVGRRYQVSGESLVRTEAGLEAQHGNFWIEMTDFMVNYAQVFGFSLDVRNTAIMTAVSKAPVHEDTMGPKKPFDPNADSLSPII